MSLYQDKNKICPSASSRVHAISFSKFVLPEHFSIKLIAHTSQHSIQDIGFPEELLMNNRLASQKGGPFRLFHHLDKSVPLTWTLKNYLDKKIFASVTVLK
jgi:hypothetical protein